MPRKGTANAKGGNQSKAHDTFTRVFLRQGTPLHKKVRGNIEGSWGGTWNKAAKVWGGPSGQIRWEKNGTSV